MDKLKDNAFWVGIGAGVLVVAGAWFMLVQGAHATAADYYDKVGSVGSAADALLAKEDKDFRTAAQLQQVKDIQARVNNQINELKSLLTERDEPFENMLARQGSEGVARYRPTSPSAFVNQYNVKVQRLVGKLKAIATERNAGRTEDDEEYLLPGGYDGRSGAMVDPAEACLSIQDFGSSSATSETELRKFNKHLLMQEDLLDNVIRDADIWTFHGFRAGTFVDALGGAEATQVQRLDQALQPSHIYQKQTLMVSFECPHAAVGEIVAAVLDESRPYMYTIEHLQIRKNGDLVGSEQEPLDRTFEELEEFHDMTRQEMDALRKRAESGDATAEEELRRLKSEYARHLQDEYRGRVREGERTGPKAEDRVLVRMVVAVVDYIQADDPIRNAE